MWQETPIVAGDFEPSARATTGVSLGAASAPIQDKLITRGAGRAAAVVPFVPAGAVVALWLFFARSDGGYFPTTWYPAAVALCFLLSVVIAATRGLPSSWAFRTALALISGLVAWSFASMLWAGSPGTAWEASNQLALLALGAAVLALAPWTARSASVLLGCWAAGVAVVCTVTLVEALRADDLAAWFIVYRWAQPTGYPNGASALAALAFWPALLLSARIQTPAVLRVALLPVAIFLLLFAMLPQSRGTMISLVLVAPLFFVLADQRLRLLARAAVAAVALLFAADPIFRVYETVVTAGRVMPVLDDAAQAISLATIGALVAAVALAVIERAATKRPRAVTAVRRATVTIVAALVVAGVSVVAVNAPAIREDVESRWDILSSGQPTDQPTGPRLGADISDQRTDYWRVSLDLFAERPVLGVGSGNFEQRYTAARRLPKPSRYPHNVWLRFLSENGAVGLLLFVGFLAAALGAPIARWRRMERSSRGIVAICVAMSAYFLLHASLDWIDRIPAIAGPAFAVPFIALRLTCARGGPTMPSPRWRRARVGAALVGLVALSAALTAPWIAVRYQQRGLAVWRSDPAAAFTDLDRAASLNPLSSQPLLSKGTIAIWLQRPDDARAAFRDALRVEENWFPHFELALLDAQAGRFNRARREIRLAAELNASDAFVSSAAARIAARRRIDPVAVNREVLELTIYKQSRLT